MANTEGLPDEALSSLLALSEEDKQLSHTSGGASLPVGRSAKVPHFPRKYLARREQMMELGEGESPAAKVILSSKPPRIYSSSSLPSKKQSDTRTGYNKQLASDVAAPSPIDTPSSLDVSEFEDIDEHNQAKTNQRPVILSDSIRERPVIFQPSKYDDTQSSQQTHGRIKESRFKQRNRNKNSTAPTAGGFPSLDLAPVGALTRKGRVNRSRDSIILQDVDRKGARNPQYLLDQNDVSLTINNEQATVDRAADSMLANMSLEEIRTGLDEINSILSPASIEFLRNRSQMKKSSASPRQQQTSPSKRVSKVASKDSQKRVLNETKFELEEQRVREEKVKTAQILSSVRTPEDMDRAYSEAMSLGLATELPASTLKNDIMSDDGETDSCSLEDIAMLTSLLRSTALRQRLLGVKGLCGVLKTKFDQIIEFRQKTRFSWHNRAEIDRTEYPDFLPVALRCLLDDSIGISHTSVGHSLLSLTLQCIHYLLMIFVHPCHLVRVNEIRIKSGNDYFILSQTCFMSEISHTPTGSELYPPTTIEPIGDQGTNQGCYRADSSAASAESDSKAFYNDPAWTLLSRMRIIPCLSDALCCISKDASLNTIDSSDMSIRSTIGILALLSVRSPGVAAAIAGHKVLLPFLVSHCLSPTTTELGDSSASLSMFRVNLALPALKLLCIIAQQSRDIAQLGLFDNAIPDLQAMLSLKTPNVDEAELQTWSLVLFRVLLRYGLATNYAESLIHISAVQLTQSRTDIRAQYNMVFSRLCDCATRNSRGIDSALETIQEQSLDGSLVLVGVWLSAAVQNSAASLQSTMKENYQMVKQEEFTKIKLAASELEFLSSYLKTTDTSNINPVREEMQSSFLPHVTMESHIAILKTALKSDVLKRSLNIALSWAFHTYWDAASNVSSILLEEQATACYFVRSFMNYVSLIEHDDVFRSELTSILLKRLEEAMAMIQPSVPNENCINPFQKQWFIEAEHSILLFLCQDQLPNGLVSTFAFSLLGRLSVGNEAFASSIFQQNALFQVSKGVSDLDYNHLSNATFLQNAFLRELSSSDEKVSQVNHSLALYRRCQISSLRSSFNFGSKAEKACLLPLGGTWLLNVLSSTMTNPVAIPEYAQPIRNTIDIVSHALTLVSSLELSNTSNGTKLYHLANICLYPEAILRDDYIRTRTTALHERLTSVEDGDLVCDFISACYHHSRLSKPAVDSANNKATASQNNHELVSADELKALDDFVGDMCDSYIEYGGQYDVFTYFIRFLMRHNFPSKTMSSVLSKLHPVLNFVTCEEGNDATVSFLLQSVSGGLPSVDKSRRDHGLVLDSFADALKNRDRELSRSDYIYLLAISVLSRNLSSSSQHCNCGIEAMKNRLFGIQESILYDIMKVCEQFLHSDGSKASLVSCVTEICLDSNKALSKQATSVQMKWTWEDGKDLWDRAMSSLNI